MKKRKNKHKEILNINNKFLDIANKEVLKEK